MYDIAGLIFADSYGLEIEGITETRSHAAVPFGARYRVIDFTLSNMMNAGVKDIGIITTQNYYSLMRHVGEGAPWDYNRKNYSLMFLPPFCSENVGSVYDNRLEAMQCNLVFLRELQSDYVLISGSNYVANIDFQKMLDFHIDSGADITGLCTRKILNMKAQEEMTSYKVDEDGNILQVIISPEIAEGDYWAPNVYVLSREYLIYMLEKTLKQGMRSFRRDVIKAAVDKGLSVKAYETEETLLYLDDIPGYLQSSLKLLDGETRKALFHRENAPIITHVKDSAPTRYSGNSSASNSLVADGVIIEGTVRNSIVFRGARIKKGALVENSVVMQDAIVGENARLNYCVLDKNTVINDNRLLSGYITHPFYVKRRSVI
jgi:glucose-1-phosphate adenylyltransferase